MTELGKHVVIVNFKAYREVDGAAAVELAKKCQQVSEETGAISVAIRGNLRRHLSPETLGRVLRNELLPQDSEETDKQKFSLSGLTNLLSAKKNGGSGDEE